MNILFMGTSEFCIAILETLINKNYNIVAIVTKPDNKYETKYSVVKQFALKNNINLYQPKILDDYFIEKISTLNINLIIVASYGKILNKEILHKYKCINIHASLLPKYRGPSPIQYSILNGDKITGITIINMNENIDTGEILMQKQVDILPSDTSKTLSEKLSIVGANVLVDVLSNLTNIVAKKQNNNLSSYTKLLSKENSYINWNKKADEIINFVHAMYPWPIARTIINKQVVKIYQIKKKEKINDNKIYINKSIGEIIFKDNLNGLCIKCIDSILEITMIQFPNSKIMTFKNYSLGHKIDDNKL